MANVTGDSASQVSSYMTAIWNNYAEGSENLEHFTDVMADLGARTASSSAEIADGLQQFVALGPVIGLSFDNAAAALAAVSSTTRESANVIGNSFKTIFSRLQGLKLGETLEDGVDLNKYSSALAKVGVSVLDSSGELKDADVILDDIMAKWNDLSKTQQTALAQTVAGTYQYARFAALMEAQDEYYQNLDWAKNADGAVDSQLEIYEESWTAAQARFQDSLNQIYNQLNIEEGAKTLYNILDKMASGFANILEQMGGVKTLFLSLAGIAGGVFSKQISSSFALISQNFSTWVSSSSIIKKTQGEMLTEIQKAKQNITDTSLLKEIENQERLIQTKQQAYEQSKKLTEQERQYNQVIIQSLEEQATAQKKLQQTLLEKDELMASKSESEINRFVSSRNRNTPDFYNNAIDSLIANDISTRNTDFNDLDGMLMTMTDRYQQLIIQNQRLAVASEVTTSSIRNAFADTDASIGSVQMQVSNAVKNLKNSFPLVYEELAKQNQGILDSLENMAISDLNTLKQYAERVIGVINQATRSTAQDRNNLTHFFSDIGYNARSHVARAESYWDTERESIENQNLMRQTEGALVTRTQGSTLESMLKLSSAAGQAAMAISSLQSIKSVFSDEATTSAEKMVSILMSLSLLIPSVGTGVRGISGLANGIKKGTDTVKSVRSGFTTAEQLSELTSAEMSAMSKINKPKQAAKTARTQAENAKNQYEATSQKYNSILDQIEKKEAKIAKYEIKRDKIQAEITRQTEYQNTLVKNGVAYKKRQVEIDKLQQEVNKKTQQIYYQQNQIQGLQAQAKTEKPAVDAARVKMEEANRKHSDAKDKLQDVEGKYASAKTARERAEALTEENAVTTANTAITRLNTETNLTATEIEELKTQALAAGIITQDTANQNQRISIALERQGVIATMAQAAAEAGAAAAVEGKNVALAKTSAIVSVLKVKMTELAAAVLANPLFWGAAAIAAVVGSLYLLSKVLSADEDRLEASKEKLQELNDTLSETKSAYENIQDSLSTYEEAKNSLDGLTKGTKEWNEALTAANEKILEILTNFPELWAYVTRDENGMFSISDKGFEEVIEKKYQEYIDAQKDTNIQQTIVNQDENAVTRKGLSSSIFTTDSDRDLYDRYMSSELDLKQIKEIINKREKTDEERTKAYNAIVEAINKTEANNTSNENLGVQTLGLGIDADFFSEKNVTNTQVSLEALYKKRTKELKEKYQDELLKAGADYDEKTLERYANEHLYDISDEKIEQYINDFSESLNKLSSQNSETAGGVLGQLLTGDGTLTEYTDAELEEVQKQIQNTLDAFNKKDFEGLTDEEIIQKLFGVDSETAKVIMEQLGVDVTDSFVAGVKSFLFGSGKKSVIENTLNQNENLDDNLKERIEKAYGNLSEDDKKIALEIIPDLTEKEAEKFLNNTADYIKKYTNSKSWQDKVSSLTTQIEKDGVSFDIDQVKNYASQIKKARKELANLNNDELLDIAYTELKIKEGADEVLSKWDDWSEKLATKDSTDRSNVWTEMSPSLEKMFNVDFSEYLNIDGSPVDFTWLINDLDKIKAAANGDEEAFSSLYVKIKSFTALNNLAIELGVDVSEIDPKLQALSSQIQNWVANNNFKVGATIDDTNFNNALNNMIRQSGIAANTIANMYGFDVEATVGYDRVTVDIGDLQKYLSNGGEVTPTSFAALNQDKVVVKMPRFSFKAVSASTNANIKVPKGTSSGSSSSGGGSGGGSGSSYEPDTLDDEFDKYYYYKKSIDDLAEAYDRLSTARDRVYDPKDYATKTAQMNANLQSRIDTYKKYQAELLNDLTFDKNYLAGLGAKFDSWGNMTNYKEFMESQKASFQKQLNAAGSDEKAEEIKKRWETLQSKVEQWQDEHDTYADITSTKEDLINKKIDNDLSNFQFELDVNTDKAEVALEHISTELSHLDHYKLNISLLVDAQKDELGEMLNKLEYQRNYLTQLNKEAATVGMNKNLQDAINDTKKNIDSLISDIESKVDNIGEDLQKIFDDLDERVESTKNKLSDYSDILENMKDILSLSGQKYTENATYNAVQRTLEEANKNNIRILKRQLDSLQKTTDEMVTARAELVAQGADEAVLKQWDDKIKEAQQQISSLSSELSSSIQSAISAVVDASTEQLENSIKKAEMKLFNIGDLELAKSYYDEYKDLSEEYLDNTEKAYELNKLLRQVNNSIADKNNITGTKELAKLADEITQKQAEGVKINQYDVDLLNAKYQLTLAQIALEEAQNSKTTMRLRRDASGNYTYVYTADADAISNAQQNVEDKQKEIYDLQKEHEEEISASWFDILQEYEDKVQELQEKYKEGIIDNDEFNKQKAALDEIYKQKIQYIYDELNKVYSDSALTFEDSILKKITGMNNLTEIFDKSNQFIKDISADATENAQSQADKINEILNLIGTNINSLADDVSNANTEISNNMTSMVNNTISELNSFNSAINASIQKVKELAAATSNAFSKTSSASIDSGTTYSGDLSKQYMNAIASGNTSLASELLAARAKKDTTGVISNERLEKWAKYYNDPNSVYHDAVVKMLDYVNKGGSALRYWEDVVNKIGSYDTGGYTGPWGSKGKLALLHEKELVLNKTDTENILDAVNVIRSMSQSITSSLANDLVDLVSSFGSISSRILSNDSEKIPQMINIDATFPNVSVASEIEEAFNDLANQAAQFASIKKI